MRALLFQRGAGAATQRTRLPSARRIPRRVLTAFLTAAAALSLVKGTCFGLSAEREAKENVVWVATASGEVQERIPESVAKYAVAYDKEDGDREAVQLSSSLIDYALDALEELDIDDEITDTISKKIVERKVKKTLKSPWFIAVVVLVAAAAIAAVSYLKHSRGQSWKLSMLAKLPKTLGQKDAKLRLSRPELEETIYHKAMPGDGGNHSEVVPFRSQLDGLSGSRRGEDRHPVKTQVKKGGTYVPSGDASIRDAPSVQRPGGGLPQTLRLQSLCGAFGNRRFVISSCMRLGRNPECNDLVFPRDAKEISGAHCVLRWQDDGTLNLEDMNSSFGTFRNGVKLEPGQKVALQEGDVVELGRAGTSFRISRSSKA